MNKQRQAKTAHSQLPECKHAREFRGKKRGGLVQQSTSTHVHHPFFAIFESQSDLRVLEYLNPTLSVNFRNLLFVVKWPRERNEKKKKSARKRKLPKRDEKGIDVGVRASTTCTRRKRENISRFENSRNFWTRAKTPITSTSFFFFRSLFRESLVWTMNSYPWSPYCFFFSILFLRSFLSRTSSLPLLLEPLDV